MFLGWGMVSFLATANSFVQLSVSDGVRGRVMSVYALVFLGLAPIGNSLIGMLADAIGTTNAVTVSAMVCIVGSVLFMFRNFRLQ